MKIKKYIKLLLDTALTPFRQVVDFLEDDSHKPISKRGRAFLERPDSKKLLDEAFKRSDDEFKKTGIYKSPTVLIPEEVREAKINSILNKRGLN